MINFNLFCPTYFGQNLFLVIGNKEYSMSYLRDGMWICDVDIESNSVVEYSYLLKNPDGTIVSEGLKKPSSTSGINWNTVRPSSIKHTAVAQERFRVPVMRFGFRAPKL